MSWTTLEMAKKQVGIPLNDYASDDWLNMKLAEAEAMVLNYIVNNGLTVPTPPDYEVSGAIYLQFAELWRFRGDDMDKDPPQSRIPGALSAQVERCILKRRAPSLG
jgi:hypothetical protein